jgi:hypothetical protein
LDVAGPAGLTMETRTRVGALQGGTHTGRLFLFHAKHSLYEVHLDGDLLDGLGDHQ